jgi:hypothetical protein
MSADLELVFPHRYQCKVLDELPATASTRRYPERGEDGVIVEVVPDRGERWRGVFASGKVAAAGLGRVLSLPNPDDLCVVARGAGYVVSASDPDRWEAVRATPILDVRSVSAAGVVVFASYTELIAYDEAGEKWRTKRLAWDGFNIVAITVETLVGEYSSMGDTTIQRFEVNLRTGAAQGGIEE